MYRSKVPNGLENVVPVAIAAESSEFLVVPVWWNDGDYLIRHITTLPSAELSALPGEIRRYWNYGLMDMSGHGPSHHRFLSCVYLIFDTGRVLWTEYDTWDITYTKHGNSRFHNRWMNLHIGQIGPKWRAVMLRTFEFETSIAIPNSMQTPDQFWFINAPSEEKLEALRRRWKDWDHEVADTFMRSSLDALLRISVSDADRRLVGDFIAKIRPLESSSDAWVHRSLKSRDEKRGGAEPN